MTDLVKQLREYGACGMVFEAADRIEQLEAALREAVEDIEFWGAYASEYFQDKHDLKSSIQNARKALEGKDD